MANATTQLLFAASAPVDDDRRSRDDAGEIDAFQHELIHHYKRATQTCGRRAPAPAGRSRA
jgi:hypothetical protein